ncbi:MAG: methyltransferase domain-containing protein, partial [Candidatus Entotheonellia bacterium]
MVREAHTLARTLGHYNTAFCQADAEALPFRHDVCGLITSKLAFHYFPHPQVALAEMVRVATRTARLVLIDRVSPEDPEQRAYQNRLEKLRTPSKTYVYSESQLVAALVAIVVGSELLVSGAQTLLKRFDIADLPFGMTILAFLVSIEELERELPAARQGRPDISFGNVLGSILA